MITKLNKLKLITLFLLTCAISFFIVEFSISKMNLDFQNELDSYFQEKITIHFDYNTETKYKEDLLKKLCNQYDSMLYCIDYNSNDYSTYYIYTKSDHLQYKQYEIGSFFNGKNTYDIKKMSEKNFDMSNFIFLTNGDIDEIKNKLISYDYVNVYAEKGEHNVEQDSILNTILQKGSSYFLIIFILYIMIEVVFFEKKQKEYAIKRIHGVSVFDILKNKYLKDIYMLSLVYWIISLGYIFILGYNANDHLLLIAIAGIVYVFLIGIYFLISIVQYFCVSVLKIKNVLSHKINIMIYEMISLLFKFISIFFLTIQLTQFISQTYQYYIQNKGINEIASITENMVKIESFDANYNIENEQWEKILSDLHDLANSQNSLYVDAHNYINYDNNDMYNPLSYLKNAIRLNESTVSAFQIRDIHNNLVIFNKENRQENPILLVPIDLKDSNNLHVLLEKDISDYEIQYIQSDQKIYSFRPELSQYDNGWIENAIIVVDGNEDLYEYMIPIQGENLSKGFNDLLVQYDIDPVINIIQPYESFNQQMNTLQNDVVKMLFLSLFSLLLVYVILYQSILIYFKRDIKRTVVLKVFGKDFLERYNTYFELDICIYLIIGICFTLFGKTSHVFTLLSIYFINFIILFLIIRNIENKKILSYLKGDDV